MNAFQNHNYALVAAVASFAAMMMTVTVVSSVVETESVWSSAQDLSNQSAVETETVASENSALPMNAFQNHKLAVLSSAATFALMTTAAHLMSSVVEMDSVQSLAQDLSHQSAFKTAIVASENSAVASSMNAFQNHNFALVAAVATFALMMMTVTVTVVSSVVETQSV